MGSYPESMYKLKPNIAKKFFLRILDDNRIIDAIMSDETLVAKNDSIEKILSIFLFLADLQEKLNEIKGNIITYDDADYILQGMMLANSEITQFYIEKAQREGTFSYNKSYSQSDIILAYIKVIYDDMRKREIIKKCYPDQEVLGSRALQIVSEFDWNIIETHLEYLKLINILMCIQISPFYDEKNKRIAEWFLDCFGDILSNCRIDEMYLEPNVAFSENEKGPRTTTKVEIFFSQSNGDRYQLRLDFPHDDINFIHFNLYEPFREAAFPINLSEYEVLLNKYGSMVKCLFYRCGNRMWFKSNFKEFISEIETPSVDLLNEVKELFDKCTHSCVCDERVTKEEMNSFMIELFSAISVVGMQRSMYVKPKLVDERKRLEHITLAKNLREAAYKIDEEQIYNLQHITISAKLKEELFKIECNLNKVLIEYFAIYEHEELKNKTPLELLELVMECIRH